MIQIDPAILTDSKEDFLRQVETYSSLINKIDVDINVEGDSFYGKITVSPEEVVEIISNNPEILFSLHLMVNSPLGIIADMEKARTDLHYFIHQESEIDSLPEEVLKKCGIAVKAESQMKEIGFYNKFSEVQLMTIHTGEQGNEFKPEILSRVEWLKSQGYKGKISIDGSVNLESASLIKQFPIDRVSVGSFFSKSEDFVQDYNLLNNLLNS